MDTYKFTVRIGILGTINVQAASKFHAEDKVWNSVQSGTYGELAARIITRKNISVV